MAIFQIGSKIDPDVLEISPFITVITYSWLSTRLHLKLNLTEAARHTTFKGFFLTGSFGGGKIHLQSGPSGDSQCRAWKAEACFLCLLALALNGKSISSLALEPTSLRF